MKILGFFLIPLLLACTSLRVKSNVTNLDGHWVPIRQAMGGVDFPTDGFQSQKLIIMGDIYIFQDRGVDAGNLKYENGKMDIVGIEGVNAGKHFKAIYKLDGEILTICYNLNGDVYPENFETTSSSRLFLAVYKKEKED